MIKKIIIIITTYYLIVIILALMKSSYISVRPKRTDVEHKLGPEEQMEHLYVC